MPSPSPGPMQPQSWPLISTPSPAHPEAHPPDLCPSNATSHCSAAHTSLPPASPGSLLQLQCLLSAASSPPLLPALLWGCALRWYYTGSHSVLGPGRVRRGGKSGGSGVLSRAVAHGGRGLRAGRTKVGQHRKYRAAEPWSPCTAWHRQEWDELPSWGHLALLDFVKPGSRNKSGAAARGHGTPKPDTDPPPQNPTGWCCLWSQYHQSSGPRKAGSSLRKRGWERGASRSRSSAQGLKAVPPEGSAGAELSGATLGVWESGQGLPPAWAPWPQGCQCPESSQSGAGMTATGHGRNFLKLSTFYFYNTLIFSKCLIGKLAI